MPPHWRRLIWQGLHNFIEVPKAGYPCTVNTFLVVVVVFFFFFCFVCFFCFVLFLYILQAFK